MHNTAAKSRFLIDLSLSGKFADSKGAVGSSAFLQHTVVSQLKLAANSRELFTGLARIIIRVAERSFAMRDINTLQEASSVLANLPITEARYAGHYYQAIAISRTGETDVALKLLERVADAGTFAYKARALQTLGSIHHRHGRHEEALRLYREALRAASTAKGRDLLTELLVSLELSCIKSEWGDHRAALIDLESLDPLVRILRPETPLYFAIYHNELAVEFAELGRIAEAEATSNIALASPFASAYPEWSETRDEIAAKRRSHSRSVVAIHRATEVKPAIQAKPQQSRSQVVRFVPGYQASDEYFLQRSTLELSAKTLTVLNAVSILNRVLICIGARAPPLPIQT